MNALGMEEVNHYMRQRRRGFNIAEDRQAYFKQKQHELNQLIKDIFQNLMNLIQDDRQKIESLIRELERLAPNQNIRIQVEDMTQDIPQYLEIQKDLQRSVEKGSKELDERCLLITELSSTHRHLSFVLKKAPPNSELLSLLFICGQKASLKISKR